LAKTEVKVLFSSRHDDLNQQLNAWLEQVSGWVVINGVSLDSNDYGHCLALLYEKSEPGRYYRAHVFFGSGHTFLEEEANRGLQEAQAHWGRFVAIGSNQYGHCLCIIEER